jgi:tetratricopeptide (TPR) repeat protein
VGEAAALSALGGYHAALGAYRRAIADCAQSLDLHRNLGNRDGEAQSWLGLGDAHHSLADYPKAIGAYHHALNLMEELGQTYNQSNVLTKLGDTHHAAGDLPAARHAWQQALPILDDLHHPDADRLRTKLNETGLPPAARRATASRSGPQPPAPERPPPAGDNTH